MTSTPPTVLALKQSFLTTQTRLLSQPLAPSRAWQRQQHEGVRRGAGAEDNAPPPLPEKAVEDALVRLNQALLQHERRVHPPQATRHVAEQIEQLYWNAGDVESAGGGGGAGGRAGGGLGLGLGGAVDFTDPETISSLPPTWSLSQRGAAAAQPLEARRYADLVAALQGLAARTRGTAQRVARLQRLHETLEPFRGRRTGAGRRGGDDHDGDGVGVGDGGGDEDEEQGQSSKDALALAEAGTDDAIAGVQENLVTRDGEIERELERMRVLAARVGGRVARLRERERQRQRQRQRQRLEHEHEHEDGESGENAEELELDARLGELLARLGGRRL